MTNITRKFQNTSAKLLFWLKSLYIFHKVKCFELFTRGRKMIIFIIDFHNENENFIFIQSFYYAQA